MRKQVCETKQMIYRILLLILLMLGFTYWMIRFTINRNRCFFFRQLRWTQEIAANGANIWVHLFEECESNRRELNGQICRTAIDHDLCVNNAQRFESAMLRYQFDSFKLTILCEPSDGKYACNITETVISVKEVQRSVEKVKFAPLQWSLPVKNVVINYLTFRLSIDITRYY